tara:strand:- start:1611 stop:1835 length:225 start_codon:yes stop_codon:yes gene_type:complete
MSKKETLKTPEEKKQEDVLTQNEKEQRTIGYLLGLQDSNRILLNLAKENPNDKALGRELRRILMKRMDKSKNKK